jgi:uncharacterized protein (TIGR00369 family)
MGAPHKHKIDLKKVRGFIECQIPFLKKVGLVVEDISRGKIKLTIPYDANNLNHLGTYQGGVYLTLAEAAGGSLVATLVDLSDTLLLARECHLRFGEPAKRSLSFEGSFEEREVKKILGQLKRNLKMDVVVQVKLLNENGNVAAEGSVTYYLRQGSKEIIERMKKENRYKV